jgi:hypothetical protein
LFKKEKTEYGVRVKDMIRSKPVVAIIPFQDFRLQLSNAGALRELTFGFEVFESLGVPVFKTGVQLAGSEAADS